MVSQWFQHRFQRWLERALPPNNSVELNRKNLFVFPSAIGFFYLVVGVVIWVMGTNYQNNLVLFIAYLMFSIFIIAIHQTFNNVSKLTVSFKHAQPVFAGENAEFIVNLHSSKRYVRESIYLFFKSKNLTTSLPEVPTSLSTNNDLGNSKTCVGAVVGEEFETSSVVFYAAKRGWVNPGRLCIETVFPLGLLRCWTWVDLNARCLVYPKPVKAPMVQSGVSADGDDAILTNKAGDEYSGLKSYTHGDEIKRIAWKASSKGKGLFVKEYHEQSSADLWLNIDDIQAQGIEAKLSGLSYWVQYFHAKGDSYGLVLGELQIPANNSSAHYKHVMEAIATFGVAGVQRHA